MLTLKAAGYVDVEAGEIVRPGIVKVDGDRIVGLGGEVDEGSDVIDLGDNILLPGSDGHGGQPPDGRPG